MEKETEIINLDYCDEDFSFCRERPLTYGRFADRILKELASRGLHKNNLHYRGFDPRRTPKLMQTGNDRDISSFTWMGLKDNPERIIYVTKEGNGKPGKKGFQNLETAIGFARDSMRKGFLSRLQGKEEEFAISVYAEESLISNNEHLGEYYLKEGEKPMSIVTFSKS